MTSKEIVKVIMQKKGKTNADLANGIGVSQATAWDRLNSPKTNNLTVNKLTEMLRYLDYDLVIMPRGKAGRIEDCYVVSDSNGEIK